MGVDVGNDGSEISEDLEGMKYAWKNYGCHILHRKMVANKQAFIKNGWVHIPYRYTLTKTNIYRP